MTLQEIEASEKIFLTPDDIGALIGVNPFSINQQAKKDISQLGFPASLIGTRVRIPREGFLYWMQHGNPIIVKEKTHEQLSTEA